MSLTDIKTCCIYPGIGIARVGDSPEGYFIGPESPGLGPAPGTAFKDRAGRICRQAARFRVYGFDADGKVVQELTAQTAGVKLEWQVALANRKANAFGIRKQAVDVPLANALLLLVPEARAQ